jgi:hypothetical protein
MEDSLQQRSKEMGQEDASQTKQGKSQRKDRNSEEECCTRIRSGHLQLTKIYIWR